MGLEETVGEAVRSGVTQHTPAESADGANVVATRGAPFYNGLSTPEAP